MKVMHISTGDVGYSSTFVPNCVGEIVVAYPDGDQSAEYIKDFMVWVEDERWVGMPEAFKTHLLITDNHDTRFFEPKNAEDRERGYTVL